VAVVQDRTDPSETTIEPALDTVVERVSRAEELRALSHEELMALYLASPAPESVRRIEGHPAGVAVAAIILRGGRLERRLRTWAESDRFLWHGKSFVTISDNEGWGYNRLGAGPMLDAFPFRTFVGPSRIDGRPSLILDFNVPRNPWWERLTWDELREVGPGVFAGTTGLRVFGKYRALAWFACDTNRQTPMHGA
jgi:hypothetical protein